MPHDLFDSAETRPPSARTRRSSLVVVSLTAHAALIAAVVAVSLLAPGILPVPQRALAWEPVAVRLVDIPLPERQDSTREEQQPGTGVRLSDTPTVIDPRTPDRLPDGDRDAADGPGGAPWGDPGGEPLHQATIQGVGLDPVEVAPVPSPPQRPVRLHSGIQPPRKINDVPLEYPPLARQSRVEGIVILEATIDSQGFVQSATVLRSVSLLDEAAVRAVRQWRFEPARLNGEAIAVVMTVTVHFRLR